MNLSPENSTFAQNKVVTEISTVLKKNVGTLRKHFRRKASSIEEEPRRLLGSISKHLAYILNSHHPLQSKLTEIFQRYTNKAKNNQNDDRGDSWEALDDSKEEVVFEESKDHGVGSNMTEQGIMPDNNYVPLLLKHYSENNDRSSTSPTNTNKSYETKNKDRKFDTHSISNIKCQT